MSKGLVRGLVLLLMFIMGMATGAMLMRPVRTRSAGGATIPTGCFVPALQLNVYDRDGKLIYSFTKVGDPPTLNFIKIFAAAFSYYINQNGIQWMNGTDIVTLSGATRYLSQSYIQGSYSARLYYVSAKGGIYASLFVGIGNGTGAPSITDYKLSNQIAKVPVTKYAYYYNATHMWVEFRAYWTPRSTRQITEVGLYVVHRAWTSPSGDRMYTYYFLIFRDVLGQAITIAGGQTLEIIYRVYFRYA